MFIDSHAHGIKFSVDSRGRLAGPVTTTWEGSLITPEEHIRRANAVGLGGLLLLDPPEVVFPLKEIFGDFVYASPQVDLDTVKEADIDAFFERGAIGIKFIAPTRPYCDDSYLPIYKRVLAHNGLAVFHTGYVSAARYDPGLIQGRGTYLDITHMRPATLDRVSRAFPELKILMAHYGNPWWEEAWKMTESHANIYADLSGGTAKTRDFEMWRQIFAPNGKLDTDTVGKLCYGKDGSALLDNFDGDLKMMGFYTSLMDFLKVPEELRQRVYSGNCKKLCDLRWRV